MYHNFSINTKKEMNEIRDDLEKILSKIFSVDQKDIDVDEKEHYLYGHICPKSNNKFDVTYYLYNNEKRTDIEIVVKSSPPKPFDEANRYIFEVIKEELKSKGYEILD